MRLALEPWRYRTANVTIRMQIKRLKKPATPSSKRYSASTCFAVVEADSGRKGILPIERALLRLQVKDRPSSGPDGYPVGSAPDINLCRAFHSRRNITSRKPPSAPA